MGDKYVETYKKLASKTFDLWNKKLSDIAKKLKPIDEQIASLEKINKPTDADKKKLQDLQKRREDLRRQAVRASSEVTVNVMRIKIHPSANQQEVKSLAEWLKALVRQKGTPITNEGVTVVTDIAIDDTQRKLTNFNLTLQWRY
jgi:hypothetical protein